MCAVHQMAKDGFKEKVNEYEQCRPGYPAHVVDEILRALNIDGKDSPKLLDLAAGTGKFTRELVRPNFQIYAVDQSAEMLQCLSKVSPTVKVSVGTATKLEFADGTFDAVFVAQGFHWFSTEEACKEIYRVLKPGGGFCCLWNREDVTIPWLNSIVAQITDPHSKSIPQYFKGTWKEPFENSEWVKTHFGINNLEDHCKLYRHSIFATKNQLWGNIISKSYINQLPASTIEEIKKEVDEAINKHNLKFDCPGDSIEVPYTLKVVTFKKH